ncbi:hypothetical protein GH810_03915 [Acetobacterium paludosum]|uniref:Uncharacterized protein n=1 Tax=Acetobacterium paludosum TaxID=52693 RepID=A0A923KVG7_9FIRM|nr:hypothetical protein [Acetobacterium paludosum]MBC3887450.1 hypothetical protein [Acetobacterium paludosum]
MNEDSVIEEKTKLDAILEAKEKTTNQCQSNKILIKKILENSGVIITVLTTLAFICLYGFQSGKLLYLGLPNTMIQIDLMSYCYIITYLMLILTSFVSCYSMYKADQILDIHRFRFDRFVIMLFGLMFFIQALGYYTLQTMISITFVAILIEFVLKKKNNLKKPDIEEKIPENKYKDTVAYYSYKFLEVSYNKLIVIVIIMAVCASISTGIGYFRTTNQSTYQILEENGLIKAIVVDYSDTAIVFNAEIIDKQLFLHNDKYMLISKENLPLTYTEFNNVVITR